MHIQCIMPVNKVDWLVILYICMNAFVCKCKCQCHLLFFLVSIISSPFFLPSVSTSTRRGNCYWSPMGSSRTYRTIWPSCFTGSYSVLTCCSTTIRRLSAETYRFKICRTRQRLASPHFSSRYMVKHNMKDLVS